MQEIDKIKKISIWIFLIPFVAINLSLFIVTNSFEDSAIFHKWVPLVGWVESGVFPYIDGHISISRAVRYFPTKFIFKPSMIITALLLINYWSKNRNLLYELINENKNLNIMYYFGVSSAICLIIHAIFLDINFDINLYKFFRRFVLISFILFEILAQAYFISIFYQNLPKIKVLINEKVLFLKRILVTLLIITAIIISPFLPFNDLKLLKHALEWNYFVGIITFYLLTFFFWNTKVKAK